jgi:ABC-type Fe3+-siderophore transport system permease subunit
MDLKWLDILGLVIAMSGAIVLGCAFVISRNEALRVGVSRVADYDDELNVKLPHVCRLQRQSRCALVGVVLLVIGFLLQIAGSWPR